MSDNDQAYFMPLEMIQAARRLRYERQAHGARQRTPFPQKASLRAEAEDIEASKRASRLPASRLEKPGSDSERQCADSARLTGIANSRSHSSFAPADGELVAQFTNTKTPSEKTRIQHRDAEQAMVKEYLAELGLSGGYVIFYLGEPCGWRADLREASGWRPGCIAVDADGNRWGAMGGSDNDGAERWERIG